MVNPVSLFSGVIGGGIMLGLIFGGIGAGAGIAESFNGGGSDSSAESSNSVNGANVGVGEMGDDLPWNGTGKTPTTYAYRNCTDFVFWRINRDRGVGRNPPYNWVYKGYYNGNGQDWGRTMTDWDTVQPGETLRVGDVISVKNCVSAWGASCSGYGHVAIVGKVNDDGSVITENYGSNTGYSTITQTKLVADADMAKGNIVVKRDPNWSPS